MRRNRVERQAARRAADDAVSDRCEAGPPARARASSRARSRSSTSRSRRRKPTCAAAADAERLPAPRRSGARPRIGADRSDARLRHAAEDLRRPARQEGELADLGQPRTAAGRASSSRCSIRRGLPEQPFSPNRLRIALIGAALGLVLAVGLTRLPRISRHDAANRRRDRADAGAAGHRRDSDHDGGRRRAPAAAQPVVLAAGDGR